jgi:hypothetical protein
LLVRVSSDRDVPQRPDRCHGAKGGVRLGWTISVLCAATDPVAEPCWPPWPGRCPRKRRTVNDRSDGVRSDAVGARSRPSTTTIPPSAAGRQERLPREQQIVTESLGMEVTGGPDRKIRSWRHCLGTEGPSRCGCRNLSYPYKRARRSLPNSTLRRAVGSRRSVSQRGGRFGRATTATRLGRSPPLAWPQRVQICGFRNEY